MDIKSAIIEAMKELVVPEMDEIKSSIKEIKSIQQMTNKRIDDLNGYFLDLSRRIDQHSNEIQQVRNEVNQVKTELSERMDRLNDSLISRIDVTNDRIDRLYDVVVRREEHEELKKHIHAFGRRLKRLEEKVGVV